MKQVGCNEVDKSMNEMEEFDYTVEQFADLQLLRYKVYGFEELSLKQKKLIYYLSQAALQGRDILFDQNGKYNLLIRKMLETVYTEYQGDRTDVNFVNLDAYGFLTEFIIIMLQISSYQVSLRNFLGMH